MGIREKKLFFLKLMLVLVSVIIVQACNQSSSNSDHGAVSTTPGRSNSSNESKSDNSSPVTPPAVTPPIYDNSPCTRYPVMLLHGFLAGSRLGSFAGAKEYFDKKGCRVMLTEVSTINGVEYRGGQIAGLIKQFMAETGASKVNMIAHSQGGLDARYAISTLHMDYAVASLSTLSTPHRGTEIADFLSLAESKPLMQPLTESVLRLITGMISTQSMAQDNSVEAFKSLSTNYVQNWFNPHNPDMPGVYYQSWGARTGDQSLDDMKFMFMPSHSYLSSVAGENDGIISIASSQWGNFRGVVDADHLDLVGVKIDDQDSPFDHLKFLDMVIMDLKTKGF